MKKVEKKIVPEGGYAAGDSSLKLGRIDKFYQLCRDKACKKGLLIIIQYGDDYNKAMTAIGQTLSKYCFP